MEEKRGKHAVQKGKYCFFFNVKRRQRNIFNGKPPCIFGLRGRRRWSWGERRGKEGGEKREV